MSDAHASRVGTMFGPYHLKRLLGRGGMGEVYEAEHTVKEWTVAVKLMSDQFSSDPVFRERMKREARIAGRLQEPHVVPIHEYGEIDGKMFLEMRLIEGTDLDSLLKRFGPLTPPRAVAIISQVASALDAAHSAGVMHRDIKPPNILVTRADFAYLVDFGIASAVTDEKLTQLGTAVGTWKYMAPERFSDRKATYRADIYALACVLHECLTGSPPYKVDSAGGLVSAHLMEPVPQASTQRSGIPKSLDAVIACGMAKKAEDRDASAGDLALAAREALSDPDQDHADSILRRSEEATPSASAETAAPTLAAAPLTPPPAPPASPPSWNPSSGPVPSPPYYQGNSGNWGTAPPGPPAHQPPGPMPWNLVQHQPPPRKRSPWPIVAGVALLVVLLVGGVGIWVVTRPKPAPPPPDLIAANRLSGLLLSPSDINAIMGASSMEPSKPITSMDTSGVTLSSPDCQSGLYTSQEPVYAGTGYTGVSALVSAEPGDNNDHWLNQAVVLFPSTDKARSFLQNINEKWKGCAGKTVTVTNKGKTYRWTFAQVIGEPPKIAMLETQEGADGWECQRALSVANNVIVDINACGYKITDQGTQVADKIIAKVNGE
jgi:serine/threonine kinase PknH